MASRWIPVAVLGEVAEERRPKLDAMLLAKKPGLTANDIHSRRIKGLDAFFRSFWNARDDVRFPHPRDVDEEDVWLRVDQHVWKSLLDDEVDGKFPWAGVKPPRSKPHDGYARWFMRNAPMFEYPPLEERTQLWAELLNKAPYDADCGPFEVTLLGSAWPLVNRAKIHALLDDLPAGLRMAAWPVDVKTPEGPLTVAMCLQGPREMETASALQVARMKNDLVRCFFILRLWAKSIASGAKTSLEDFFIGAYRQDLAGVANLFPGYHAPAPGEGSFGFVEGGEVVEQALPAPTVPAVQTPSAGSSSAGLAASEPSRDGPRGGVSRGESSRDGKEVSQGLDTHLETKEEEDGVSVADGESSTLKGGKGKQREDAAHDGDE